MPETPVQPDRIPIFSKRTNKLMLRVSEDEHGILYVWAWCKINKEWEPFTVEELRSELEVHKGKQVVV